MDEGERMPIRLVQENGDTISLDATQVDIVVERVQSNFGIPLMDAKRMGIDVNQSAVTVEVQGVFADDLGQEESSQATAILDFYQPQQIVTWGQPVGGSGGNPSGPISSGFNSRGSSGGVGATTGLTGTIANSWSFSGGIGGSLGGGVTDLNDLGNRILKYWNLKYIDFPVAYWIEESGALTVPVSSGMQLWLKADAITNTDGSVLPTWNDSSGNGGLAQQLDATKQPKYRTNGINGKPYVQFDGSNDFMEIAYSAFFNSEEFTVFAVAKTDATAGDQPVFSSIEGTTGGSNAKGYALRYKDVSTNFESSAYWQEGSTTDDLGSGNGTVKNTNAFLPSYVMKGTNSDSESDEVELYLNGGVEISQSSGVDYQPNTSASFKIGEMGGDYFQGGIYEIIVYNRALSVSERQEVEGYLSFKYNISLNDSSHPYWGSYAHNSKHVRVVFDKEMVGSKQEPYGFLNQLRSTSLEVTSVSGNTLTLNGDPRQWFELTESNRNFEVLFAKSGDYLRNTNLRPHVATVTAVTSNSITIRRDTGVTVSDTVGSVIEMSAIMYADSSLIGAAGSPVIVLPIKNADTFDENADPEKAVGPEFPNHEDGSARDGSSFTRTDEYITYLLSKALTSSYLDLDKVVDASGNKTIDKAFSTVISESAHAHNCRLTITQQYASSLGSLSDSIDTTLGVGQMPVTQGFSGGRSGKRVKSGGDKVQDMIGILANSNNFATNPDFNGASKILRMGVDFLQHQIIPKEYTDDFIRGIQIPYLTEVTKGKNVLDSHIAQRNFFITTEGNTSEKLSSINTVHASRTFANSQEGHLKNGISGLVSNFNVSRSAEEKAYEFALLFNAADIIL